RQTGDDLRRSYELGAKFLIIIGWAIVIVTLFTAPLLIRLLGGRAFLPDAADTLRLLIWFAPLHYLNGITQYAIIAVDRQRAIAPAYLAATLFNLGTNLVAIPVFGYRAAAITTILTEVVLFVLLQRSIARYLGTIDWATLLWRPLPAVAVACLVGLVLQHISWVLLPFVLVTYGSALILLRVVRHQELALLRPLLPQTRTSRSRV
ncbi:MAG: polysaccharide biosynthesis C-terminal domain-containing protein, partial [Thermomicrobium sp.]|nr:polysaccharide biosynthesis C-terminal domain-containing protein [Thermomicrobium sp.]MDW8006594.1 polysaccharide biosynthesis C-terminal domain-containing protein [Thermomicrobium sp.]